MGEVCSLLQVKYLRNFLEGMRNEEVVATAPFGNMPGFSIMHPNSLNKRRFQKRLQGCDVTNLGRAGGCGTLS